MKLKVGIMAGLLFGLLSCSSPDSTPLFVQVYQTSASGDQLTLKEEPITREAIRDTVEILPEERFQMITGFGGAFTESSAYLLQQMSPQKREEIMAAYFGDDGARYSLTRTTINSCDFSLSNYAYDTVAGDTALKHFSIAADQDDIIPMIKQAQQLSSSGFKIVASPWTAPPWMKDNQSWKGGRLLEQYYPVWANYFDRYLEAYTQEGIPIWALTVENEPLGNGENWESMHYTAEEMGRFVKHHLGPVLKQKGWDTRILVYDQNRDEELLHWSQELLYDTALSPYVYGTAVHWYSHTQDWRGEVLSQVHEMNPNKHLLHTEGCIDAEVPHWQEDSWYWSPEATDWGWDWAPPELKKDHPKYVPVYRYARDIIGCMNNWVEGWIDWNMVLDDKGGPNWANNWCIAPVIVKPQEDKVYYTPLYYTLAHFSKFIRPEAQRIGFRSTSENLMMTAVENTDGSRVMVLLNMADEAQFVWLKYEQKGRAVHLDGRSMQTWVIPPAAE